MLSQSSPSLNRFPGLTLKAWALVSGSAVVKGFNVSNVVARGSFGCDVVFGEAVAGAYVFDIATVSGVNAQGDGVAAALRLDFKRYQDGADVIRPSVFFVAVYG